MFFIVGVNLGNGIDFFQVGCFDVLGIIFDGFYGNVDQVDFLDGLEVYFNVDVISGFINVVFLVVVFGICDIIDVYMGDILIKFINFVDFLVFIVILEVGQEVFVMVICVQNLVLVSYVEIVILLEVK